MNKGMNVKTKQIVEWETPPALYAELDKEFGFTLDPCATEKNTMCKEFFTMEEDGLAHSWLGHTVYCNPPYGDAGKWVLKAIKEQQQGTTTVMLLPARTEVSWFHDHVLKSTAEIRFLRGRVKFLLNKTPWGSPRFGSMIVVWRGIDAAESDLVALGLDGGDPVVDWSGRAKA